MRSLTNRTFLWMNTARLSGRKLALVACVLALGFSAAAQGAHTCRTVPIVTSFDYPQAQQTQAVAISNTGEITGAYEDRHSIVHGFLRDPDGNFTSFDPSGSILTFPFSINTSGQVAGYYIDPSNVYHGFLRNADGSFVAPLDAPGAGTGRGQGTMVSNINPMNDEIAGTSIDSSGVYHSFVWVNGTFTVFDAPGAGTGTGQGTETASVDGLNPMGVLAGTVVNSAGAYQGYVRNPDGTFRCGPFDVTGDGNGPGQGTSPGGINQAGIIEGAWIDSNDVNHGFVGPACGTLTLFDVPGAGTGPGQGTSNGNINALGEIASSFIDSSNVSHGFVREPNGSITKFDAPGAGTGSGQGTVGFFNNASGQVTGWYYDGLGLVHGFLRSCN